MRNVVRPATGWASVSSTSSTRAARGPARRRDRSPSKLIARSHGQDFHAAVGIVAHPSGDAQDVRLALHEPAEADALHPSAHDEAAGLRSFSVEVISATLSS